MIGDKNRSKWRYMKSTSLNKSLFRNKRNEDEASTDLEANKRLSWLLTKQWPI